MTREEFEKLKPGDKVKIVSERVVGMNVMGYMDKWLGKVMTVKERSVGGDIHMIEDQNECQGGWYWAENMIECKMPEVGKMIRILTRGGKTIAKYGKKAGIARCSTVDKYDEAKGAIIAVARLYGYDVVSDKTGKVTLASEERRRSDEALDKLAAGIFGKPLKETAKDRVKRELSETGYMERLKIGYKGFEERNGKLYCRDMEYKVGEIAEVPGKPKICEHGIHFCWNLNDVHEYYNLRESVICEVEPLGDIVAAPDGKKCCTNRLKIIRMLTREEVWKISNTGSDNTGFINTGNWNTGDRNTGDRNTGNWNTGNCNTGNWNTSNCNTGDCNTGNCNTGNCNTGDRNTGDWNTGDWNTGFFNTKENECYIFDKPSGMTPTEFRSSKYYTALCITPLVLTKWIYYTDEEKAEDKAKELIGGYLKRYGYKEACANWWAALSDENKEVIKQMPNFDADKFEEITGIKV